MNEFHVLRILLLAADLFGASALIMAAAWLASFRATASARHLVWAAAFGALIALPMAAALVPGNIVLSLPAPDASTVVAVPLEAGIGALSQPQPESFHLTLGDAAAALIAVWAFGVFLIGLRGIVAAILLRALRRDSIDNPFDETELPELGCGRLALRVSNAECGPVTWGIFRPVILLPNKALYWPGERLHAVLQHELAHIRRHDSLAQMLSLAACALYWPNPLVWLGARALRREAEMAADDAVLVSGMMPSDYAGELLQVAAEFRAQGLLSSLPLSMAAPSALEARLKSVLASAQPRSGVTSMDVLKMSGIAILATTALVLARPSLAQDAPQAPPAPPAMTATVPMPPAPPADAQAPAPPADAVSATTPVRAFHTREVRNYKDRNGHHHVEIIERDGDSPQTLADVQPDIDAAMAQVKHSEYEMRAARDAQIDAQMKAVGPQVEQALAEARAELSKISDEKIRSQVDAALARAQARIEAAQAHAADHHGERRIIERDGDQDAPDGK
ncbi:MAG TPA: M56 family metallopeptidase [Rhizomicrobium sp.]|jgi:beta-lactamase regulating signal transducer with metallopeptidase domain/ElaB/YqjD/DUF883 family membrane-anchored ribosome-binding protein|nr:M56 family metallopeptidase [Rhizomicrobium sp.]